MQFRKTILLGLAITLLACGPQIHAQWDNDEECGNKCRLNVNLAALGNVPVGTTSQVATTGWGVMVGIGRNLNKRHALIGEFMWNRMNTTTTAAQTFQSAISQPNGTFSGDADILSLTANYRYERRGRWFGAYLIGGGGWYLRDTDFSQTVTVGTGTVCNSTWLWWGFRCSNGTVNAGQSFGGTDSNVFGGNGGGGITVGIGHAPYRMYAEARYHYAPTQGISTRFVGLAFGIRY